jgi:hypothetical protein
MQFQRRRCDEPEILFNVFNTIRSIGADGKNLINGLGGGFNGST